MRIYLIISFLLLSHGLQSQTNDTLYEFFHQPIEIVDKEFLKTYKYLKPKFIKVYPYALYAADVLDKIENDVESIKKRRKRNKFYKASYKALKNNFKYALLDMYRSEGVVLMKLIARETGMSVYEIIRKYRGKDDASMFNLMGKIFDQDLKSKYDSKKDFVLEALVNDLEKGKINISKEPLMIKKGDFKAKEKLVKENRKKHKKAKRKRKRKANKIK